jgi:PHD/YefM family antitoxin component YafN of YafNO toxin-antitoxin module
MSQLTDDEHPHELDELEALAHREPVEITRHGRRELVLMSAHHYDWLLAAALRAHGTAQAADVILDAVRSAEMDPEHRHLDELLK